VASKFAIDIPKVEMRIDHLQRLPFAFHMSPLRNNTKKEKKEGEHVGSILLLCLHFKYQKQAFFQSPLMYTLDFFPYSLHSLLSFAYAITFRWMTEGPFKRKKSVKRETG